MFNDKVHKVNLSLWIFSRKRSSEWAVSTELSQILMPAFKTALKNKSKKVQPLIPVKDPQISLNLDCTLLIHKYLNTDSHIMLKVDAEW